MTYLCTLCGGHFGLGEMHLCGGRNDFGDSGTTACARACRIHGGYAGDECPHCAELRKLPQPVVANDARAILWARTYHWGLRRYYLEANTRGLAVAAANNAVCDFDEHYLGRRPTTKGTP